VADQRAHQLLGFGQRARIGEILARQVEQRSAAHRQRRGVWPGETYRTALDLVAVACVAFDADAVSIGFEQQPVAQLLQQRALEAAQVGFLRAIGKAAQRFRIDRNSRACASSRGSRCISNSLR
jgi:hypothetical protein